MLRQSHRMQFKMCDVVHSDAGGGDTSDASAPEGIGFHSILCKLVAANECRLNLRTVLFDAVCSAIFISALQGMLLHDFSRCDVMDLTHLVLCCSDLPRHGNKIYYKATIASAQAALRLPGAHLS